MDQVMAQDLAQLIGASRRQRAVLASGVNDPSPLGQVTPILVDASGRPLVKVQNGPDEPVEARVRQLEEILGEVQETPTHNTVLARLKALADTLGTEATLQDVKIALDSLNNKDYATQATLADVLSRLEAIEQRLDSGDAQVQLKGQIPSGSNTIGRVAIDRDESSPVVTHPRQILTSSVFNLIPVPVGAVGVKVETVIHGVTGTFGAGQGVRTDAWGYGRRLSSSVIEVSTQRTQQSGRSHFIWWYPGIDEEVNLSLRTGNALRIVNSVLPPRINFRIDITGTFEDGQGVDCEQFIEWLF